MRKLILMRHAKAEAKAASGDDFDRALAERGRQDAALMGRVLAEAGLTPDLALVSAAERTRQTWAGLAGTFSETAVRFERKLYNATSHAIREAIAGPEARARNFSLIHFRSLCRTDGGHIRCSGRVRRIESTRTLIAACNEIGDTVISRRHHHTDTT